MKAPWLSQQDSERGHAPPSPGRTRWDPRIRRPPPNPHLRAPPGWSRSRPAHHDRSQCCRLRNEQQPTPLLRIGSQLFVNDRGGPTRPRSRQPLRLHRCSHPETAADSRDFGSSRSTPNGCTTTRRTPASPSCQRGSHPLPVTGPRQQHRLLAPCRQRPLTRRWFAPRLCRADPSPRTAHRSADASHRHRTADRPSELQLEPPQRRPSHRPAAPRPSLQPGREPGRRSPPSSTRIH